MEKLEFKKHYPKDWVVMQNRVIECFRGMSLYEKRLFLMATPLARVSGNSSEDPVIITVAEYAKECGIDLSTAYTAVEEATQKLFKREFTFIDDEGYRVMMRWLYKAKYNEGSTYLYFPDEILQMLRVFDGLNPYTKYKKEVVLKLKKDYSLELYHLAKKHYGINHRKEVKFFEIKLDDFISLLQVPKSYNNLSNLKKRVVKPSLDEINEKTDITITYENIKKGRSVIGFRFFITTKDVAQSEKDIEIPHHTQDIHTIDWINGGAEQKSNFFKPLTPSQAKKYSILLHKKHEIVGSWNGSYDDAKQRIEQELQDSEKVNFYMKYLLEVGFILND